MEGTSHPSINNNKSHHRNSDFGQQQMQPTLIDVELSSTLTSVGRICFGYKVKLVIDKRISNSRIWKTWLKYSGKVHYFVDDWLSMQQKNT